MSSMNEDILRRVEGTDNLSLARGLALGLLETLTSVTHELSYMLFEGSSTCDELLETIKSYVEHVRHNSSLLYGFASNFDEFADRVRTGEGHE